MKEILLRLNEQLSNRVLAGVSLAPYTSFKIGGPAEFFFTALNVEDMVAAVHAARAVGIPYFLLGGGTNLWISDMGIRGLVIRNQAREIIFDDEKALCDSGVAWGLLTAKAHERELVGMESLAHVPGTIGGAVRGNSGSFRKETKDLVTRVLALRGNNAEWINAQECGFAYRHSVFKTNDWIVLRVELQLARGDVAKSKQEIAGYLEYRRRTQPLDMPCPGCMFKNPDAEHGVFSSKLIDELGLKGLTVGNARVSHKHANFIENLGGARSQDVCELVRQIKQRVFEQRNIMLEEEVVKAGFET